MLQLKHSPSAFSALKSPPALSTAFTAASFSRRLFSFASASLRALVLELPLGATSDKSFALSLGVKLTKSMTPWPVGVLGVFGVLGVLGMGGAAVWMIGPALPIDLRRFRVGEA